MQRLSESFGDSGKGNHTHVAAQQGALPERPFTSAREQELIAAAQNGDAQARTSLFENYLPFCNALAEQFSEQVEALDSVGMEDIEQLAQEKLLKTLDRYEPQSSTPFPVFAADRIENALGWHIKKHTRNALPGSAHDADGGIAGAANASQQRLLNELAFMDAEADHDPYSRKRAVLAIAKTQLEPRESAILDWSLSDEPELDVREIALITGVYRDDLTSKQLAEQLDDIANEAYQKLVERIDRLRHKNPADTPNPS